MNVLDPQLKSPSNPLGDITTDSQFTENSIGNRLGSRDVNVSDGSNDITDDTNISSTKNDRRNFAMRRQGM